MNRTMLAAAAQHANEQVCFLPTGSGFLAAAAPGARVVALLPESDGPNLFWSNPVAARADPSWLGGERMRFASEDRYAWNGPERDVVGLAAYQLQSVEHPGRWTMTHNHDRIDWNLTGEITDRLRDSAVRFTARRQVAAAPCPVLLPPGVTYAGYQARHFLEVEHQPASVIALWSLIQIPIGATALVPLTDRTGVRTIYPGGDWRYASDSLRWQITGSAQAKIAVTTAAATGRIGAWLPMPDGRVGLLVRQHPVLMGIPGAEGLEGPTGSRADEVVQVWDGCSFGEIEHQGPAIGGEPLPSWHAETILTWGFLGAPRPIAELANRLLTISVAHL